MAGLLSCPAELRQQILGRLLPHDVHNAGVAPRTAPLLPLLLTCKVIRLDVLQILDIWSPLYHIENPAAIINTSRRIFDNDKPHMRMINLRLFAGLDLKKMRNMAPMGAVDDSIFDVDPWLQCVALLPRNAVESVTVDLTPAPAWMAAKRPDWVRGTVLDARNRAFLEGCAGGVRDVVGALCDFYDGGRVSVQLGGIVPQKARRAVGGMVAVVRGAAGGYLAGFGGFAGEWLSGPRGVPTRLSLKLVCHCWGMEVGGLGLRVRWYDSRMTQIRNEAHKEGLRTPDLDLRPLFPVCWSKNSCTAYYVNAQEDEERTREELIRLLAFAVEARTGGVPPGASVDFAPAIRARRFLLHRLAEDLRLASVSVGNAGEKFVRVSRVVEAAVGEQELIESGGSDVEDVRVGVWENSTSSSSRVTKSRRPGGSCCAWAPIQQLFGATGGR